jgi:5-methyltetrahydrofolate--homocysteine methyltransferase
MMGVTPERAVEALAKAGADTVGANCGAGIIDVIEICRIMRSHTSLPLWMKPNAGLPELIGGNTVYHESPADMASHIPALLQAGANIVGGCCGTTPDHIRKIRDAVNGYKG